MIMILHMRVDVRAEDRVGLGVTIGDSANADHAEDQTQYEA